MIVVGSLLCLAWGLSYSTQVKHNVKSHCHSMWGWPKSCPGTKCRPTRESSCPRDSLSPPRAVIPPPPSPLPQSQETWGGTRSSRQTVSQTVIKWPDWRMFSPSATPWGTVTSAPRSHEISPLTLSQADSPQQFLQNLQRVLGSNPEVHCCLSGTTQSTPPQNTVIVMMVAFTLSSVWSSQKMVRISPRLTQMTCSPPPAHSPRTPSTSSRRTTTTAGTGQEEKRVRREQSLMVRRLSPLPGITLCCPGVPVNEGPEGVDSHGPVIISGVHVPEIVEEVNDAYKDLLIDIGKYNLLLFYFHLMT